MTIGLARVTICAPQRRVDVALPEHVPLAELLPEVLRHAGEDLADAGERHGGWVLRRADGAALETGRGLHSQGVRDGEVLHLRAAQQDWPELEYDDVVEAFAEGARRRGGVWTPAATRATALVAAATALTGGLIALLGGDPRGDGAGWAGLGLALVLVLAATTASRAYGAGGAGVVLGGFAVVYAFAGGVALVASAEPAGASGAGAPELLAGCSAALVAALLSRAGVVAGARVFTAGVTTGVLGAAGALTALVAGPAAGAAALLAVLVCGVPLLPVLAIRLGRTPMPPVSLPVGVAAEEEFFADVPAEPDGSALDAIRRRPDRAVVLAAVRRTDDLLTGLLLGHAVLVGAAAVALAGTETLAARLLLSVSALALLLRSRLFRTRRQRLPLVAAGLATFVALGADLLGTAGADVLPAVTAGCVLLALVIVVAGVTWSDRVPSPYLGRAADLLDVLATVSVIPVACAVAGLYGAISGISF
ncbi:type VII secretion integral membrane protein EccD [Actinoplanes teichomyceticus]|uniref:Type VII secretion integral membrane protein EccD n=1 Tax=Actinoplanes teichomyceticus TaxID=1867 RepID=A0A561WQL6_ACTTI|nr:type VII secretion integral membrane protein EccD [Actinoplanes teichomyceticus]TWG26154.1 type VII secretion integral membrane protein EccD [Actinoplanes teichomyceticus]GIF11233.1 hypothetical protein Ate01nite_12650 [Actinoplanes teichomyceticus]